MRRLLFFSLLLSGIISGSAALAQPPMGPPDGPEEGPPGKRIADRMALFIERKMRLSERERTDFMPLFIRYEKEYRDILRSNRQDRLLLQQQLIDLQLRYRKEFGPVVGNRRVIEIYDLQQYFIRTLRDLQQERRGGPGRPGMRRPLPPGRSLHNGPRQQGPF